MLKKTFKKFEMRLFSELKSFYKDRLISVAVFGSVARETQSFDSDIDILIIAKGLPRGRWKRMREFDKVGDKLEPFLKSMRKKGINTYISAIIKSPEEAEIGSPIFLDMVEDARILFDKNDFLKNRMERLKNRLKKLGAKRIWRGNAWYWDLKPDYKQGEIFEIF